MKPLFFTLLLFTMISGRNSQKIDADDPNIYYTGRIDFPNPKTVKFAWPGVSIKAKFEGKKCTVLLKNYSTGRDAENNDMANYYNLIVDGHIKVLRVTNKDSSYAVDSLSEGTHTIELFKRTEGFVGNGEFKGFELEHGKKLLPIERLKRKIEFIGNSVAMEMRANLSYATLPLQRKIIIEPMPLLQPGILTLNIRQLHFLEKGSIKIMTILLLKQFLTYTTEFSLLMIM